MKTRPKIAASMALAAFLAACAVVPMAPPQAVKVTPEDGVATAERRLGPAVQFLKRVADPERICNPRLHIEARPQPLVLEGQVTEREFRFLGYTAIRCIPPERVPLLKERDSSREESRNPIPPAPPAPPAPPRGRGAPPVLTGGGQ